MALPRTALLGILGAVLILATFVATHSLGKKDDSGATPPVQQQTSAPKKATATPAKPSTTKSAPAHGGRNVARHTSSAKTNTSKTSKTSSKPAQAKTGSSVGLPLKVAQAFAQHRVVVLYFGAQGADDTLTAASVRELKTSAGSGVTVLMDKLSNLADYRRVVEGLDVSQAPSIVIVDRARKAQLLEGFVDAGSLRQVVADVTG
jgi:cytoskeletal protein RodZ